MGQTALSNVVDGQKIYAATTNAMIANTADHEQRISSLSAGKAVPTSGLNPIFGKVYMASTYSSFAAFISAIPQGGTGCVDGTFTVTSPLPDPAKGVTIFGMGNAKAVNGPNVGGGVVIYNPNSANQIMINVSGQYNTFRNFQVYIIGSNGPSARAFVMNNSFCSTFENMYFGGGHNATAQDSWSSGSWGTALHFLGNAGDNFINGCWFLNLGRAVVAESIQNFIVGGSIRSSWVSLDVSDSNGGCFVSNITFLGQGGSVGNTAGGSLAHFRINGGSGQSSINQCWFEGAQYAIQVVSSPSAFSVAQCKVSGYLKCVYIHAGNNILLQALNVGQGPSDINAKGSFDVSIPVIVQGITTNTSGDQQFSGGDLIPSVFPIGSVVEGVKRVS